MNTRSSINNGMLDAPSSMLLKSNMSTKATRQRCGAALNLSLYAVGQYGWTSVQRDFEDCRCLIRDGDAIRRLRCRKS